MGKVLIKCVQTPMQKYFYDRSLDSGFDFDKMSFLLNHGKMIKEKCLECWNLRMCAYCLAQIPKDNQILTENMLLQQCEKSKESTLLLLYKLCILVEFGYIGNENLHVLKLRRKNEKIYFGSNGRCIVYNAFRLSENARGEFGSQ